jgi:hypothetical protein
VHAILGDQVIRREVGAPAEPGGIAAFQPAKVRVHRRDVRVTGVQHQGHPHRPEGGARAWQGGGHLRAHHPVHVGEVDPRLLEDVPLGQHLAAAATAARALPLVGAEGFTVEGLQSIDDLILQGAEVSSGRLGQRGS